MTAFVVKQGPYAGRDLVSDPLRILSLGAGVQSSTLALMAAVGDIPPVDCAIFADTGCEPAPVYRWLEWLETQLPYPVHHVTAGALHLEMLAAARGELGAWGRPPFYVVVTSTGKVVSINRQYTGDYKLDPIRKKCRELIGLLPRQRTPLIAVIEQVIGISSDEARRAKPSRDKWIEKEYPLIDMRISRGDCLAWMHRHGYPMPPKSACTICPFRSNAEWRHLRDSDPDGWHQAVMVDEAIRHGMRGVKAEQIYLHRSGLPLRDADLSTPEDLGQLGLPLGVGTETECSGMCGV